MDINIIDCLVEDLVIVELKAVEKMVPLYEAQLLTYLKLSKKSPGLRDQFQRCAFERRHKENGEWNVVDVAVLACLSLCVHCGEKRFRFC